MVKVEFNLEKDIVVKPKNIKEYKLNEDELFFKRQEYVTDLLNIMGVTLADGVEIEFDDFRSPQVIKKFKEKVPELKRVFSSNKLTALHKDANIEQVYFPINMLRQLLKEIGYKFKPIVKSDGYFKKKKRVKRFYKIVKESKKN